MVQECLPRVTTCAYERFFVNGYLVYDVKNCGLIDGKNLNTCKQPYHGLLGLKEDSDLEQCTCDSDLCNASIRSNSKIVLICLALIMVIIMC